MLPTEIHPAILAALAVGGLVLVAKRASRRRLEDLRRAGVYPPEGQGSDEHVLLLFQRGEKIEAIRLYRELHGCGLKEAKAAVEARAREAGLL